MVDRHIDGVTERLDVFSDPARALASFLDHTPIATALYDTEGHCVRVNPAYVELFGTAPALESDLSEDPVLFWLRRAFSGEAITTPTFWYEHQTLPASGARRRIALSARAFPLGNAAGAIESVAISFRDETDSLLLAERRRLEVEEPIRLLDEIQRAELERRTNEEQFRAVFEQCADGVMLTDDLGRVLDINPSGCRIFGRRLQDIVGSRYWDHIGDVAESKPLSEQLLEDGTLTAEVQVWRADGRLRDLELRSVANFLPHRHLTTFLDVTERNDALHRLQRSEEHLIASQRIAHVGSWEFELTGSLAELDSNVLRCSDECWRIFGVEPGTMKATPAGSLEFVHPDDRPGLVRALREAIESRSVYSLEHRVVRPDGSERVVQVRGEIIVDPDDGRLLRVQGTTQDVTERTRARREIEMLNEDLERRVAERTAELETANRDLEAFTYSVSHDLRAPLRAINGYAKIVLDEGPEVLDETAVRSLERIQASACRMDDLIDGLLALSRLGRRAVEVEAVDTRPIVEEAIEELSIDRRDGIEIVLGELPLCDADPALLRQLFVNLVGNAVKFSRDRTPARVEVGSQLAGESRVWFVKDNGIGFDMEHAPSVFGVFQRLASAQAYEGTGLGLAIVERIVKRHDGRIWVETAPGRGAAFYFTLGAR
jgi:PAS domain S-box-containing protein